MNLSQYAKHSNVSLPRASKWVSTGILKKSVTRLENGRYVIDEVEADKELEQNLNTAYPTKATPVAKKKKKSAKPVKKVLKKKRKPAAAARKKKRVRNKKEILTYQDARTRKEVALAIKHEFELDVMMNKYILSDEIKKVWTNHIAAAKTKLLGIGPELTPMIREMIEDTDVADSILQAIKAKINGVLTELAKSKI